MEPAVSGNGVTDVYGFEASGAPASVPEEPASPWESSLIQGPQTQVTGLNDVLGGNGSFVNGQHTSSLAPSDTAAISSLAPFVHASATVPVGRETREYRLTLQSYLWAPLTFKNIEWAGQFLYRARRM
jgi:hypothetical protein